MASFSEYTVNGY
ncbi:uncharacterized protein FFNC_05051 [Fusarium fujikuroi]|nr:uncharacterized protein FFNC_05051 [Fusarium fujikuroi]